MANVLRQSPWILDTAGAATLWPSRFAPSKVVWSGPTTVAHVLELTDVNGKVLLHLVCEVAGGSQQVTFPRGQYWNGLKLPTLGSGTVYIYHR